MIKLDKKIIDSYGIGCLSWADRARETESFASLSADRRESAFSEARNVFEEIKDRIKKAEDDVRTFSKAAPEDIYDAIYGNAQAAYSLLGCGVILACRSGIDFDYYPKDVRGLGVTYKDIRDLALKSTQLHINGVLAAMDGNNFEDCVIDLHQWGMRYAASTGITTDSFHSAIGCTKDDVDARMLSQVFKRSPDKAVRVSDELCSTLNISPTAKRMAFSRLNPIEKVTIYDAFCAGRSWVSKHFGNSAERFNIELSSATYAAKGVSATYSSFNVS